MALVVGDGGIEELLGAVDQAAQLIGQVAERVASGLRWRDVGEVEFGVGRCIELRLP